MVSLVKSKPGMTCFDRAGQPASTSQGHVGGPCRRTDHGLKAFRPSLTARASFLGSESRPESEVRTRVRVWFSADFAADENVVNGTVRDRRDGSGMSYRVGTDDLAPPSTQIARATTTL